jgi:hypothetical protein
MGQLAGTAEPKSSLFGGGVGSAATKQAGF